MDNLKMCPFDGAQPVSGVEFYGSDGVTIKLKAVVRCPRCNVSRGFVFKATDINLVPFFDYEVAFEKAKTQWNQRSEV